MLAVLAANGCYRDNWGPTFGAAKLSGVVTTSGSATALSDATVSIGNAQVRTDASGHFQLTDLPTGTVEVTAARSGYTTAQVSLTLASGINYHDFALEPQEVNIGGASAVHAPTGDAPDHVGRDRGQGTADEQR